MVEELDGAGNSQVLYIYGDDLLSQSRDGEESYYHYDGLGSTRVLSDSASAVTDAYVYDASGNLIHSTGNTENDYRFNGQQIYIMIDTSLRVSHMALAVKSAPLSLRI